MTDQSPHSGYTLIELLTAASLMGIVVTVVGAALITVLQVDRQNDDQSEQRYQLRRALEFMADDIKEALEISLTVPPGWNDNATAAYAPIFYLQKPAAPPAGGPAVVAYYVRPKSFGGATVVWRGPQVIYRLERSTNAEIAAGILDNVGTSGRPLVDAISVDIPACTAPPGTFASTPNVGVKLFLEGTQSAKLCLAGFIQDDDDIVIETQAFARSRPSP